MAYQIYLVALGANISSNVGNPYTTLRHAIRILDQKSVKVSAVSRFFHTPCFPAGAGPDYVNATAAVEFDGTAAELLHHLHQVEAEFGRAREERWGQRSLDLDLLAAGDVVLPNRQAFQAWQALPEEEQRSRAPDELILPHPRIQDRAFVLVPLADIAADWVHPVLKMSVREMLARLTAKDVASVVPL